jgi:multisubunit Na+/H+ antiporter MnhB subunit
MRRALSIAAVLLFGAVLFQAVMLTGSASHSMDVPDYYLANGMEKTGSANIVNSIVWDFRGYDTLGEEVVLFSATLGVIALFRGRKKDGQNN